MRKIIAALALGFLIASVHPPQPAAASTYSTTVLGTTPYTYWRLNDASPTNPVVDSTTTGNSGTLTTTPDAPVYGLTGGVYNDTTSKAISSDGIQGNSTTATTVTGLSWTTYFMSTCQNAGVGGLFIQNSVGTFLAIDSINISSGCQIQLEVRNSALTQLTATCAVLQPGTWMAVGYIDNGAGTVKCYVNGVATATITGANPFGTTLIGTFNMEANQNIDDGALYLHAPESEVVGWTKAIAAAQMASVQIPHPGNPNPIFMGAW